MATQLAYSSKLHGRRVLIIGGSSGIGYATASAALSSGAEVMISSSNPSRVASAVSSLRADHPSSKITGHACDLGDEPTLEANILDLLRSSGGRLNHIVFTAGDPNPPTPISSATLETIRSAGTVRYVAPIFLAKHAPAFLEASADSSITLTTGVVTARPLPGWSMLAGMRTAVIGLGRNLALDLRPVRVNVVAVGAVDTDAWGNLEAGEREGVFRALVEKSATGRVARAGDVAEAYVYCMRDGNVTGSVIETNGGALLM